MLNQMLLHIPTAIALMWEVAPYGAIKERNKNYYLITK
jgi:hypothetical protein